MSYPSVSAAEFDAAAFGFAGDGALLQWYLDAGVDECIAGAPVDRYAQSAAQSAAQAAARPAASPGAAGAVPGSRASAVQVPMPPVSFPAAAVRPSTPALAADPHQALGNATHIAQGCRTLAELKAAVEAFDGCPLKITATTTVFADGNPKAPLLVIGEAPGRDEDRIGRPFVGESGQLLDKMLASIGITGREEYYITNVLPWRPPGNRVPTDVEVAVCLPFLIRHIELVQPQVMLLVGGLSAKALFAVNEGITRLRGRWRAYQTPGLSHPVPAIATFHPAYLLRSPVQKRLAWRDMLDVREKLAQMAAHSGAAAAPPH
ncbi:uracil-DNA glycosylase [Novispirillum itersonii]|uniref:uracil-DNA glycosylase n=1 Tax=Novispirillum itersonii TaxID=189 RepID=UPI00036705D1|nr:uracil-DNA glycosylase [Novispirillum itersonii]